MPGEPLDVVRRALLTGAAHAAGIGSFDWDLTSGRLVWDEPLLEAFGYDGTTFDGTIGAFSSRLHPDDLPRVDVALERSIATCGDYHADFRVVRPDGSVRWMSASGCTQPGPDGRAQRLVGVATDVTGLREDEARLREVLESMAVGYLAVDADWRVEYVNAVGRLALGSSTPDRPAPDGPAPGADPVGRSLWEVLPAAVGTDLEGMLRQAAGSGQVVSADVHHGVARDTWYELHATPHEGGLRLYLLDITARREALTASDREARRANVLARVATALVEDLDPAASLRSALQVLVPVLGDWAIASTLAEGTSHWRRRLRDVASYHPDPALDALLEEYRAVRVAALTEESPVGEALRTSAMAWTDRSGATPPGRLLAAGPAHRMLTTLNPVATVVLPLQGRGPVRGLITVVNGVGRGAFTPDDLTILREVSAQIGLALDNAHLHAVQRDFAEQLQRDLLSELPVRDGLELGARYSPAADGARVGGDWYDAFGVPDGGTCLVVGDVTGHDQRAAVQMAQVRNVLRGVAHALVRSPAEILAALDRAVGDLAVGAMATAVLATVARTPGGDGTWTLRWSNAGHLPPLLLHPDGTAVLLDRGHDLLLGLAPDLPRRDHTVVLAPGSTLLLCTDGLVERRGENLDVGLERLRRTAERLSGAPLPEFCDAFVAELLPGSEDDVALLAVRVGAAGDA